MSRSSSPSSMWAQTWSLIRPYFWESPQRASALALIAFVLVLSVFGGWWQTKLVAWMGAKTNALQSKNREQFYALLPDFCWLLLVLIVVVVMAFYLAEVLEIRWRRWFTKRLLARWFEHRAFYQLELMRNMPGSQVPDNPDQRIHEDVQRFVSSTCSLVTGLMVSLATLVVFGAVLAGIDDGADLMIAGEAVNIPGFMLWVALLYCGAGTLITYWLGRALKQMNFELQKREAHFRYHMARVRDNAEAIALDRAQDIEHFQLDQKLEALLQSKYALVRRQTRLSWFTNFFSNLSMLFPYLVLAERYFGAHISMGTLVEVSMAFGMVQTSLSWFINNFSSLAEWRASAQRLAELESALDRAVEPSALHHDSVDSHLAVDGLELRLPSGRLLLQNIAIRIEKGCNVLIGGPSGCGKSTLLRAFSGIWPFAKGHVSLPDKVMFIPQQPYFPEGRLRDALAYPSHAENYSDTQFAQALMQAGLSALQSRLDDFEAWQSLLSGGERQRLAVARVLLKQPAWVFADEASSALDNASEARVYEALTQMAQRNGGAVISVAHRDSVRKYHQQQWLLDPKTHGLNAAMVIERPAPSSTATAC